MQTWAKRAARGGRRAYGAHADSLHQEVLRGGALGACAGALFASALSGDTVALLFGSALGGSGGLILGLLVWIGSADLPEAPIPPVRSIGPRPRR